MNSPAEFLPDTNSPDNNERSVNVGSYERWAFAIGGGALTAYGLTRRSRTGLLLSVLAHVHKYIQPLLSKIENGDIDPSFVITHRLSLDDAPRGYENFKNKEDACIKVVLKP